MRGRGTATAAHDSPMPDPALSTVSVTNAPSIPWDQLEVNIHEVRPGSPIWQVHVHELIDDLLDDAPRWSPRMMLFDHAPFAEHWFNAGGLDTGEVATGRLPWGVPRVDRRLPRARHRHDDRRQGHDNVDAAAS